MAASRYSLQAPSAASPDIAFDTSSLFTVAAIAALPLLLWLPPAWDRAAAWLMAPGFHNLLETLYIAGATGIFCVAWYSPRGECRLRSTLVACLCLAVILFDFLHLATYPGMPELFSDLPRAVPYHFGRLASLALPAALLALAVAPRARTLPNPLRWGLLCATLGLLLPLGWHGLAYPQVVTALYGGLEPGATRLVLIQWGLVAAYLTVAVVALRYRDMDGSDARHLFLAAILAAVSEAFLIPGAGYGGALVFLSHVYRHLALAAAFFAVYGEAISLPYRELEGSRAEAHLGRDRLGAVFKSIADGVIVVDNQLRVQVMNPVACHLAGKSVEGAGGMALAQVFEGVGEAGCGSLTAEVEQCLREGRAHAGNRYTTIASYGGLERTLEHSISPITDQWGQVHGAVLVLHDVTERWHLLQRLSESADYARNLIEASLDAMLVVDLDGRIADVNDAAELATGRGRDLLVGSDFSACFAAPASAHSGLERVFAEGMVRDLTLGLRHVDGGMTEVSCNITPYRCPDGKVCGAFVVARDITDIRQVQLQLNFQANHDALTALPNRRHFRDRIAQAMAQCRRSGRLAAVMLVDLDNFKDINDTLGHAAGDDLLKQVGGRLVGTLRETDTVARFGGDEFAILLEDIARAEDVLAVAGKLLHAVTAPLVLEEREVSISCSIGVSIHPLDSDEADTLLRNADTALYRAKEAGKNQYRFFTADMNATVQRRVDLGNRLRTALARGEFSLAYQPQVELASGAVCGVEALLRWNAAGLGAVSPSEFIPIAEESGAILPIGAWVLEEACRQAAAWRAETGIDLAVAVNLSARQFRDADIAGLVARVLDQTGLPPRLLELELTESMLMRNAERAADIMMQLKHTGVSIAIDDFGTGYSSLGYLKRFPLDYLKIDRSFVTDIPGDRNDEAIVRSTIALAHSLGLKTIAEGVESFEQSVFLRNLGCEEIQGYYVSRPLPPAALLEFLCQNGAGQAGAAETLAGPGFFVPCLSMAS